MYYAITHRDTLLIPMVNLLRKKHFSYIITGLIFILLFSRLFGTGILWREIMGDNYDSLYKDIIQEGLELTGYMLVGYGSLLHLMYRRPFSGRGYIAEH